MYESVCVCVCASVCVRVCKCDSVLLSADTVSSSVPSRPRQGERLSGLVLKRQGEGLADIQAVFLRLQVFVIALFFIVVFCLAVVGGGVARQGRRWRHRGRPGVAEA